jgi:hypothetical protein
VRAQTSVEYIGGVQGGNWMGALSFLTTDDSRSSLAAEVSGIHIPDTSLISAVTGEPEHYAALPCESPVALYREAMTRKSCSVLTAV